MVIFFGLMASAMVVMLSLTIQRRNIVIISAILAVATIAQYLLLDKMATVAMAVVSLSYGLVVAFENKLSFLKNKWVPLYLALIYSAVFFSVNHFTFSIDLLAYVASLTGVLIMAFKNQLLVKYLMLVNGFTWVTYQISTGAYGQLPGEALYAVGVIVSLVMLHRALREGKDLNTIPEIGVIVMTWLRNNLRQQRVVVSTHPSLWISSKTSSHRATFYDVPRIVDKKSRKSRKEKLLI